MEELSNEQIAMIKKAGDLKLYELVRFRLTKSLHHTESSLAEKLGMSKKELFDRLMTYNLSNSNCNKIIMIVKIKPEEFMDSLNVQAFYKPNNLDNLYSLYEEKKSKGWWR